MNPRIAVIYYSATGNVHQLAQALANGAAETGAEVRLRRVAELAPASAVQANPRWAAHQAFAEGEGGVPLASLDDLEWADGLALGSPTRFGLPAAQLKQFIDQTGGLWAKGKLADKVVTAFSSASTLHGGLETTVMAILNTAYHWGAVIMPLGYSDPAVFASGNPYGASHVSIKSSTPGEDALRAAAIQGRRLARISGKLSAP